jgi:hypothetical protein
VAVQGFVAPEPLWSPVPGRNDSLADNGVGVVAVLDQAIGSEERLREIRFGGEGGEKRRAVLERIGSG